MAVAGIAADAVSVTDPRRITGRGRLVISPLSSDTSLPGWFARCCPAKQTSHNRTHWMKESHVEIEGVVHTVLPGTMFRVELDNKHLVLATISGKMRKRWVRLTVGDRVKMEMSPYDLDKARIVWRLK